jgi:hypothetical protein
MNLIQEFALLFAVAAPVLTILGMNLMLMFEGERGTLIFPTLAADVIPFPQGGTPAAPVQHDPANDPHYPDFRHAA